MPEGTIDSLKEGYGFIRSLNDLRTYFFHKNCLKKAYSFDDLNTGDTVVFSLRPSSRKQGQQEAFNVMPKKTSTAPRSTAQPDAHNYQPREPCVLPYGFLPIDLDRAIIDAPVWHDGSNGGDLLSGEILCELEALTPLLPGNARYSVDQAKQGLLEQWGFAKLYSDKQIAEPLRLPDRRVVIPGSALKGMLRHSLGALTSAPMERVGERHFTYRPNLDLKANGPQRYVVRPALVVAEHVGGWDIDVFDDARAAQFVRQNAEQKIRHKAVDGVVSGIVCDIEKKNNHIQVKPESSINLDHRLVDYKGGIDGNGLLGAAFTPPTRTYHLALVPRKANFRLQITADLYQHYLQDQDKVLASDTEGHLTGHPLDFDSVKISKSIRDNARFLPGQLIYVELTTDPDGKVSSCSKVVSCGHHFRYRWAYTSSIREQNGKPRNCLYPLACEQSSTSDGDPSQLTGARLLFGYVRDDKTNPIGDRAFVRLAGRIAINHAVSDGIPQFLGSPNKGYCIPLKILGQPKPSAWEFYLQQPEDLSKPLNTYGDLPDNAGGELAGRKFYRHQPDTSQSEIEASVDQNDQSDSKSKIDLVNTDQATLARYICQTGTRFRFAIRFARLRPWELGALLAVLEPHHLALDGKSDDYAHKLGLGRPLGMGSVRIKRQAVRIRTENEITFLEYSARESLLRIALDALKKRLNNDQVQQWLSAHRMVKGQRLGYPLAETKDKDGNGKGDWSIYNWHTDVRRQYSQLRRKESPGWSVLAGKIRSKR